MSDGEDCGGVIAAPAPSRRRNRKLWKTSVRLVLEKQPRSVRQEVMIETEEIEASDIDQIKFEKNQGNLNDEGKIIEIVEKKFEDGIEVAAMEEANEITPDENPEIKEKTEIENTEIQENKINNAEDKETEETMETNATEENTAENPEITTIQTKIDEDGETEIQNEKNNENDAVGEDIIHTPEVVEVMDQAATAEVVTTSTTETRIGSATTTRIQGVLANELAPLHVTVQSTDKNVVNLNSRVGNMEHLIGALCSTVETLNDIAISSTSGNPEDSKPSAEISSMQTGSSAIIPINNSVSSKLNDVNRPDIVLLDRLVSRIEHLSSDVANIDNTRQLREDNLILRKELQSYRERESQMMNRLASSEQSLNNLT